MKSLCVTGKQQYTTLSKFQLLPSAGHDLQPLSHFQLSFANKACSPTKLVAGQPSEILAGLRMLLGLIHALGCINTTQLSNRGARDLRRCVMRRKMSSNTALAVPQLGPRWLSCLEREGHSGLVLIDWVRLEDYCSIKST